MTQNYFIFIGLSRKKSCRRILFAYLDLDRTKQALAGAPVQMHLDEAPVRRAEDITKALGDGESSYSQEGRINRLRLK